MKQPLNTEILMIIFVAILVGTLARLFTLREDYRQYPSFPNGYLIHLTTGMIASALGAVALPALLNGDFVAVTFLALAIQQFREVRKIEMESLLKLEHTEFVPRGNAYVDGIAKTFEARNYFTLLTSLNTTLVPLLFKLPTVLEILLGVATGAITAVVLKRVSKGGTITDVCKVELGELSLRDCDLYVDDIYLMNLGVEKAQQLVMAEGYGVVITPKSEHLGISVANYGQRQAIAHEAARSQGLKRYIVTRRDFNTGRIGLMIVPIKRDPDALIVAIKSMPLLESVKKSHLLLKNSHA